jgi:hypothetical protein
MMKKLFIGAFLITASLAACGGKKSSDTTPANTGGTTETKTDGAATGGATYGAPAGGGAANPCAGGDPCAGK